MYFLGLNLGIFEEKVPWSFGKFQKVWPFSIRRGINPANWRKTQKNDFNDNGKKQQWRAFIIKVIPEFDTQIIRANEESLWVSFEEERKFLHNFQK